MRVFFTTYKKLILFSLMLVILTGVGALAYNLMQSGGGSFRSLRGIGLPECSAETLLSVSPINEADLAYILPLGNFNPPDHTLPTDHIYFILPGLGGNSPSKKADVLSPGKIKINRISKSTAYLDGKLWSDDYAIDFSSCKDNDFKFGHVTSLAEKLEKEITGRDGGCSETHPRPEDTYRYCNFEVDISLDSGELVGTAGGASSAGLDLWAHDFRAQKIDYANPSRYNENSFYVVCPLDLFTEPVQNSLYQKLGGSNTQRTVEPLCGTVDQDIAGTLQGAWFYGDIKADCGECWSKTVTLAHDNVDPTIGSIVIGGTFTNPGRLNFRPKSSGLVNREFSEVRSNEIYCYQSDSVAGSFSGKILIQLVDSATLKVEKQSGSCIGSFSFQNPYEYQR